MEKISKYLAIILSIALTVGLSACGKKTSTGSSKVSISKENITLKYLRVYDESDTFDAIIKAYQENHPNIEIVVTKANLQSDETIYDYQQDLIKQIADGAGPDMFMINNNWLPYQKNQIFPMPSGLMTTETYADLFPSIAVNDFIDSDKIYAIPYYLDNLVLYWNTNIIEANKIRKIPKTWQELVNLVPQLTKIGPSGDIQQSALPLGAGTDSIPRAAEILATLMMQYGAEMTSPDRTKATFNLPDPNNASYFSAAEALSFYTSFANPSKANYTYTDQKSSNGNRSFPMDIQAFMEGKSAMFIGYSYHVAYIRKLAPSLRFETSVLPQLRLENPVVIANYWGETVSKNSQHPNEAWDFIRFVARNGGILSSYTNATKRVPSLKTLLANYDRQYYGAVARQVNYSQSWYRNNTLKVEDIFSQMINNVLHNNLLPLTAIDVAARDVNALKE